jgi:uncharacterized protein
MVPGYATPPVVTPEADPQARQWGMFCHLFALAGYFIPMGHIIGPLVAWLVKKDQYPFVKNQGAEALNFQISVTIYMIPAVLLMFACVGFVLVPALAVFDLVMIILASVKANSGQPFRYPLTIRFIK